MPFYQSSGFIPSKRHTLFKRSSKSIYYEELISRKGFSSMYSNVYHLRMPTKVNQMGNMHPLVIQEAKTKHQPRHIQTQNISNKGDIIYDRIPLLFNDEYLPKFSFFSIYNLR